MTEPVLRKNTPREYTFQESHEKRYSNFGIERTMPVTQAKDNRSGLKIFTVCVAIFLVTDFFLHKIYFKSSCEFSHFLQGFAFLRPIADFCSGFLAYWSAGYLIIILPVSPFGYVKTTHYLVIYFGQLWLLSWMKPSPTL